MLIRNALRYFASSGAVDGDPIAAVIRDNTGLVNSAQYPDGWTIDIVFKGTSLGTHVPDGTQIEVDVTRYGYVDGMLTTFTETIPASVGVRLINPNDTQYYMTAIGDTTVTYALTRRVFANEAVTAVRVGAGAYGASNAKTLSSAAISNDSTLAYEKPVGKFVTPFNLIADASDFYVEFAGTHWAARNGQQFCCVDFIATDETGNSVAGTVSQPEISPSITGANAQGVYAEVWRWLVPRSTLTQGQNVTVRAQVKPWIGDATAVLDTAAGFDGVAYLSAGWTQCASYVFLNDKTGAYGLAYAYVDPVSGTAGGVVSTVAATARATPFQTIVQAANAIVTYNNANFGRANHSNGRIRLMDTGQHVSFGSTMAGVTAGKSWLIIEDDPLNAGNAIFTSAVGSASNTSAKIACDLLCFRGRITIQPPDNVTGSQTMLYSGSVAGNGKRLLIDTGVTFSGFTSINAPVLNGFQWQFGRNFNAASMGVAFFYVFSTNVVNWALLAGINHSANSGSPARVKMCNVIGCRFTNVIFQEVATGQTTDASDGGLWMNTKFEKQAQTIVLCNSIPTVRGYAIETVLVEIAEATGTSPCFQMGADGGVANVKNVNIGHCLFIGNRTNWWYVDDDTCINAVKSGTAAHCIIEQDNRKSDTFVRGAAPVASVATAAQRTGNWRGRYNVDNGPHLYLGPDYSGDATTPALGLGDHIHPRSVFAQTASVAEAAIEAQRQALFTTSKAGPVLGGGGDYTWKTPINNAHRLVAAGEARNRFALNGVERYNDGTGMPGPYERA